MSLVKLSFVLVTLIVVLRFIDFPSFQDVSHVFSSKKDIYIDGGGTWDERLFACRKHTHSRPCNGIVKLLVENNRLSEAVSIASRLCLEDGPVKAQRGASCVDLANLYFETGDNDSFKSMYKDICKAGVWSKACLRWYKLSISRLSKDDRLQLYKMACYSSKVSEIPANCAFYLMKDIRDRVIHPIEIAEIGNEVYSRICLVGDTVKNEGSCAEIKILEEVSSLINRELYQEAANEIQKNRSRVNTMRNLLLGELLVNIYVTMGNDSLKNKASLDLCLSTNRKKQVERYFDFCLDTYGNLNVDPILRNKLLSHICSVGDRSHCDNLISRKKN